MKKAYPITFIAIIAAGLFSCKKNELSAKAQNSKLIIGTWKAGQQNTKIYDLASNELLKDSTTLFNGDNAEQSWTEIFDSDGNAYIVTSSRKIGASVATNDTTTYSTYDIVGTNLMQKQTIGGSQTKPILVLNATTMGLQYSFKGALNKTWGLTAGVDYKIVQATYYNKL